MAVAQNKGHPHFPVSQRKTSRKPVVPFLNLSRMCPSSLPSRQSEVALASSSLFSWPSPITSASCAKLDVTSGFSFWSTELGERAPHEIPRLGGGRCCFSKSPRDVLHDPIHFRIFHGNTTVQLCQVRLKAD